jgi:CheY-like chemotaxis protein
MTTQPTILVVEDDMYLRQVQVRLLQYAVPGAVVVSAENVAEALELYTQEAIDLVITDHNLPDGSGIDIIRTIRQRDHNLPIILTSAYYGNEFGARAAGATRFLAKPIEVPDFIAAVRPLLGLN